MSKWRVNGADEPMASHVAVKQQLRQMKLSLCLLGVISAGSETSSTFLRARIKWQAVWSLGKQYC